jgi:3-oxoacyl-[acyl-carrier protein] reductase
MVLQSDLEGPTMDELKDKVVIVTGASRGIGAATAREFARHGARLVLTARTAPAIERLAREIGDDGGEALAVPGDVAVYADVEAVVRTAVERFGRLDLVINNAGVIEPIARLEDGDPSAW